MGISVYLADLRHDYSGVLANDCMPLNVGYMKAYMDRSLPEAESRLFAYPAHMWEVMRTNPPDVLMLSNYMWNENLSLHFASLAKELDPNILVVMGGPNIPLEDERKLDYLRRHSQVDLYVLGEGDVLATEVVQHFLDTGKSLSKLGRRDIPSSIYRNDGELVINKMWNRKKTIDEIPSPWLSGALDPFFDGRLAPMMETNRGCPFTCTFCVQGTSWYTKVHYFSVERLEAEIDYIGARIKQQCPQMGTLRIADSNYGMFERDIDISALVGEAQRKYRWPTFIDATTGKNRPERIIQSLENVSGALVLYQAVQSLDNDVLRQVKRSNIKKEAYEQIMIHVRGRGLRSLSDLILGLPGETLDSHLESIHALIDAGTHEMHNFQAMMLKGSEMETEESRRKYGFENRFRVLPKNFGIYAGRKVFDMDEIVVATDTLSLDDYIEARKYHLACSILWNNSWFEDVVAYVLQFDITRSQWLDAMVVAMENDDGVVGQIVSDFVEATTEELFQSEEECADFYRREENFRKLEKGQIGDNLMYRFRAIASFFEWNAVCRLVMTATRDLVERTNKYKGEHFEEFWSDFCQYEEHKHAHGRSLQEIVTPVRARFRYNLPEWAATGRPRDPAPFRLDSPAEFEFRLSDEGRSELEKALQVWSTELKGLTKGITRIRPAAQLREGQILVPINQPVEARY